MDVICLTRSRFWGGPLFQLWTWRLLPVLVYAAGLLWSTETWGRPGLEKPEKPVITLAADPWCPYNCLPGDAHPGYMIEIAKAVFQADGYQVRYRIGPWSRVLREAHTGEVDGAVGATLQNGYGLTFGRRAMGVDHTVIGVKSGRDLRYQNPHSLDGLRVGVIANYGYDNGGPIDQYLLARARRNPQSITVIASADALPQLVNMLVRGHIDALLANSNVLQYTLKRLHLTPAVRAIDTGAYDTVWIAFEPNEQGHLLADLLDKGLERLRRSGRLKALLAPYGLQDWKPMLRQIHESRKQGDPSSPIL